MRLLIVAVGLVGVVACGTGPTPLSNTHDSAEALAAAVLDAFAAGDAERLRGLAVSEQEFRQRVWPELPAARPERNLPFSYVWGELRQKSEASLTTLFAQHGGRPYALVAVRFGATTPYQTFTVRRDARFLVREAGGGERELRLCGSLLEQDGRWKVFSFVVDD